MTQEQSLFWYGIKADLVMLLGIIIIVGSLFLFLISYWLVLIGIIIGIIIFLKGKAMRFQYKMKSGSIIHRGDW